MATLANLVVQLTADTRGMQTGLRGATRSFNTFAATAKKVGTALAVMFATRKLKQGLTSTLSAFREQEDAIARLQAALIATGKAGDSSLRQLTRSASEFQEQTTFGDEAIIKATASLAQLAPALDTAALAQAQKAMIGIASAFTKGDLEAAALAIGKTVGSTTSAVSRYGIVVDSTATQQEKMAQILDQTNRFFDVAKAGAQTTGGKYDQFKNTVGDLKEQFGFIITKIFGTGTALVTMKEKVEGGIKILTANQNTIIAWGKVLISAGVVVVQFGLGVVRTFFNMGTIVARILGGLGKLIVATFTLNRSAALEAVREMRDGVLKDLGDMVAGFEGMIGSFGDLRQTFLNAVQGIQIGLEQGTPGVIASVEDLQNKINKKLSVLEQSGVDAGRSLVRGLISGIGDQSLGEFLKRIVGRLAEDWIIGTLEDALGIGSPSREYARIGRMTVAGYIQGLQQGRSGLTTAIGETFALPRGPSPALAGGDGGGIGGGGVVVNQEINFNFAALDAPSVAQLLRSQKGTIVKIVGDAVQDGVRFRGR